MGVTMSIAAMPARVCLEFFPFPSRAVPTLAVNKERAEALEVSRASRRQRSLQKANMRDDRTTRAIATSRGKRRRAQLVISHLYERFDWCYAPPSPSS